MDGRRDHRQAHLRHTRPGGPRRARPTSWPARSPRARRSSGHRTVRMRKDGSLVDVVADPLADLRIETRTRSGMAGIIRDITEEKRIEGERIRLLDQEKVARLRAEELEQRASFIAEAQAALDSSLKFDEVLRRLTRLIVPMLADWCVVHMLESDGSIRQVAVGHADPKKVRLAEELERPVSPPTRTTRRASRACCAPASPSTYARSPTICWRQAPATRSTSRSSAASGLRSAMIVPLRARSQTLGAITFVSAESERLYERGGPRVRVRAGAPGRAVDRQRAPAQRAAEPQQGARVPGRRERSSWTRRSTSRRRSRSWLT